MFVSSTKSLKPSSSLSIILWLLCLLLLTAEATNAQSDYGSTPLALTPGSPAGSYSLSNIDTVNLFNGHVNIQIPVVAEGGRGESKSQAFFTSNSPARWHVRRDIDGSGFPLYYAEGGGAGGVTFGNAGVYGIQSGGGSVDCYGVNLYYVTLTRLYFVEPDGTEHEMRDTATGGKPLNIAPCQLNGPSRGKIFVSSDGSGATFIADTAVTDFVYAGSGYPYVNPAGYLLLKSGARYRIDGNDSTLRDRSGNLHSWEMVGEGPDREWQSKDSLNRKVIKQPVYGSQCTALGGGAFEYCEKFFYKGFGGAQRTIWLTYDNSLYPLQLLLPNGRSYHFYYDTYGDLVRIDLPTGGSIEYDYGPGLAGSQPTYRGAGSNPGYLRPVLV